VSRHNRIFFIFSSPSLLPLNGKISKRNSFFFFFFFFFYCDKAMHSRKPRALNILSQPSSNVISMLAASSSQQPPGAELATDSFLFLDS
jgi:hypothetical protein